MPNPTLSRLLKDFEKMLRHPGNPLSYLSRTDIDWLISIATSTTTKAFEAGREAERNKLDKTAAICPKCNDWMDRVGDPGSGKYECFGCQINYALKEQKK